MSIELYKLRKGRLLSGLLAGLAHKLGVKPSLLRLFFLIAVLFSHVGKVLILLYLIGALTLPYKEDRDRERYGTGPRKIKNAEKIRRF